MSKSSNEPCITHATGTCVKNGGISSTLPESASTIRSMLVCCAAVVSLVHVMGLVPELRKKLPWVVTIWLIVTVVYVNLGRHILTYEYVKPIHDYMSRDAVDYINGSIEKDDGENNSEENSCRLTNGCFYGHFKMVLRLPILYAVD